MARRKQATPIKRETSTDYFEHDEKSRDALRKRELNGHGAEHHSPINDKIAAVLPDVDSSQASILSLLICVGGIYAAL
jgi:hypothetical protein